MIKFHLALKNRTSNPGRGRRDKGKCNLPLFSKVYLVYVCMYVSLPVLYLELWYGLCAHCAHHSYLVSLCALILRENIEKSATFFNI